MKIAKWTQKNNTWEKVNFKLDFYRVTLQRLSFLVLNGEKLSQHKYNFLVFIEYVIFCREKEFPKPKKPISLP